MGESLNYNKFNQRNIIFEIVSSQEKILKVQYFMKKQIKQKAKHDDLKHTRVHTCSHTCTHVYTHLQTRTHISTHIPTHLHTYTRGQTFIVVTSGQWY